MPHKVKVLFSLLAAWILLAWAFVPLTAKASTANPSGLDAIDAYLEAQRQAARIPGMAIGVVEGGQITHLRGFGVTGPDGQAVTPQTLFILGSTSKSFTALAILQQVEAGKISLDAPVRQYLTWFPRQDVTVRHLLNQTSGIKTVTGRIGLAEPASGVDAITQTARRLSAEPVARPSGQTYEYSNANYILLGALLEAVTGQSYDSYVAGHIFTPLEMRASFAHELKPGEQGMANGYTQWWGLPVVTEASYPGGHVPAGFLISSAEDMSHYIAAQMRGGEYNGQRVLSPEGIATLHTGATADVPGRGYAMGWEVVEREGLKAIEHGGDVANFHANMILLPDQQVGLVFLANTNSVFNGPQINQIAWNAAHLLVGQSPIPANPEPLLYVILGIILVIVILVIGLLFTGVRTLRRSTAERAAGWGALFVPELLLFGIAWLCLVEMPVLFDAPTSVMILFSPDLAWPAQISGGMAAVWAIIYPVLFLRMKANHRPAGPR